MRGTIEMKMGWLEVETSKLHPILLVLLGLLLVPLGLLCSIKGLKEGDTRGITIGLMLLAIYALMVWFVLRGLAKSVKYFTAQGLERRDGRSFVWTDLSRVVDRGQEGEVWRTEIYFKNGEAAWLMWNYVVNDEEVSDFVSTLPCEPAHIDEFAASRNV
jgi:hypothetical protein